MAFTPVPCPGCGGGGTGAAGADVEQHLLCDVLPDGSVAGTALAVYEYDSDGNPVGAPTFVNPTTGDPYVAQGTLSPCPGDVGCAAPVPFCFTTTTTGPVDHPGRTYDMTLPINPGFAVDSLQIDATSYPANITWAVTDADGEQFRANLQAFLAARFPDQTVTVTNPNAGTPVCGLAIPMTIHIECARIDGTSPAPDLVELIYNGGRDLVVNPAYLTTPPTNLNGPQFVYLQRQDAGGTLNCTSVANQGWETNDLGPNNQRDFELWGQGPGGLQTIQDTTPTPRGTPVQEITADINDTGANPTIWQTFTVPAAGTVRVVMVHGARDNGETHRITLSTGDDNDNQTGDIINNVTNPPQVTNAGGNEPGPWTEFQQDVALGAGVYTFALSTTNPVGPNRGGAFTDMRVIIDSPDQHAAALTDDETCVVTTTETVTTTTCEYWQPRCANGEITHWINVEDGEELTNAAFWGQAPAPSCCVPQAGSGGGGSVAAGNLTNNYTVCGVVGGIQQTLERVVITDQSGGVMAQTFVGADGGPVTPTSYTIGSCGDPNRDTEIIELCDVLPGGGIVPFIRVEVYNAQTGAFILSRNEDGNGAVYNPTGTVTTCSAVDSEQEILCDDNGPFLRVYTRAGGLPSATNDLELDGVTDYAPVGDVGRCDCPMVLGDVCVSSDDFPGIALPAIAVLNCDDTVTYLNAGTGEPWPNTTGVTVCATENQLTEEILCDAGAGNLPFRRIYTLTEAGSVVVADEDMDGAPYLVEGAAIRCPDGAAGSVAEFVLCDEEVIPAGPPVERITNGNFVADASGWTIVGNANWTNNAGYLGPDGNPGVLALNGGNLPANAVVSQTVNTGINPGDVFQLQARLGTKSTDSGSTGPIRVLVEVLDGGSNVLYSQQYVPTMLVGGVAIQWPANGVVNVPGIVATDGTITVRFTDQSGPANLSGADGAVDAVSLIQQASAGTTNTPFIRKLIQDADGAVLSVVDLDLEGDPYAVQGTVGTCPVELGDIAVTTEQFDTELLILCDANGTRFLRRYVYDAETPGAATVTNTTLDGSTAFAPVGAVNVCATTVATDLDFFVLELCDDNGAFLRRLTFNSQTGAVTATTNTTLAGAAYVPVGTVGICDGCCPVVVGEGCYNAGSGFYTAIRQPNGTITLIDSVTGAAVAAANIIPCPTDVDVVETLTAQHRLVGDADAAWTPGADVAGTLTSVTYTVLSGTATVTDESGTVAAGLPAGLSVTWNAEDANTLTGPQSIDAVGGNTYVHWTQR